MLINNLKNVNKKVLINSPISQRLKYIQQKMNCKIDNFNSKNH